MNTSKFALVHPVTGLRRMLYLVSPAETSFPKIETVPPFLDDSVPYFVLLILVEYMILVWKGQRKAVMPVNDSLVSLSGGLISQIPLLFARSIEVSVYLWVYEHWRLVDLPWDSTLSWIAALVGVDFCYYWVHRTAHEVNLFWSGHQMHHSSERYNLTTALRQSIIQRYFSWIFYLPMAFFLPPSLFAVHLQFNLIYQFWIHTQVIKKLPAPLEYVMNTPSHHRVHHGRNAYCIDKNYAGTFIIFDRIFGTFAPEKDNEPPVYGLVTPVTTFDPLELQVFHLKYVFQCVQKCQTLKLMIGRAFNGPSWEPGLPRLGNGKYPKIKYSVKEYNPQVPNWVTAYSCVHFITAFFTYTYLATAKGYLPFYALFLGCLFVVITLTCVGHLIDALPRAFDFELARCVLMSTLCILLHSRMDPTLITGSMQALYIASSGLWMFLRQKRLRQQVKDQEQKAKVS